MTCIVAVVDDGIPHFAGDSLAVLVPSQYHSGVSQRFRREPKIFPKNGMFFGFHGSVRMGQLLQYVFVPPEYPSGHDKIQYLVTQFIKALQDCFAHAKYEDSEMDGGILLALEGELFTIESDFSVSTSRDAYAAIGKASECALGSLHTTAQLGLPPQERLYRALKAAEHHTCVVGAPFTYLTTGIDQPEMLQPD